MYQALFKKMPVTVTGSQLENGQAAPDFQALKKDLSVQRFYDIKGPVIISSVPSLDTGVCSLQSARFYQEVLSRPELSVVTISMDLPFAQARWCQAEHIDEGAGSRFFVLSDYKDRHFAQAYGLLIDEFALLARAVLFVDASRVIRYIEYVGNMSSEPDYTAALRAAKQYL